MHKKKNEGDAMSNPFIQYGYSFLLEQLVGINALVNQLLDALYGSLTVGGVGYAKPLRGGVEHFAGSSTIVDELVDHQRDEELSLQVLHILRVAQELLEILLAILEVVGGEAPYIH